MVISSCTLHVLIIASIYFGLPCIRAQAQDTPVPPDITDNDVEEGMTDEEFLKDFDEHAKRLMCEATSNQSASEGLKLNLNRAMSFEDTTRLTFVHKMKNLSANMLEFPEDIKWRRDLVNAMYKIFTKMCPDVFVKHNYLMILRELLMIYLNSVEPRTTNNTDVWETIQTSLDICSAGKARIEYPFKSSGLQIVEMSLDVKEMMKEARGAAADDANDDDDDANDDNQNVAVGNNSAPAPPPESPSLPLSKHAENADSLPLDLIIDTFWMIFSHSWATCLPEVESKELWGPRFQQLFYREFLMPLEMRWKSFESVMDDLIIIAGDIDVPLQHFNLPFCTEAAYLVNDLQRLQLVRPLKLASISTGVDRFQNRRLRR